jgi:F-type H+-transporting ATPase subunit epsilon
MAGSTPFRVEVLTPDGEVFNEEITMLSTKTTVGSIGILAKHQPLLAMLDPTELRLYRSESDVVRYVQGEGYLQVGADGSVLVLVDEVFEPGQIDTAEIERKLQRSQDELSRCEEGSSEFKSTQRDVARYEAFLKLAREG